MQMLVQRLYLGQSKLYLAVSFTLAIPLGLIGSPLNPPLVVEEGNFSTAAYVRVVKNMQGYLLGKSMLFAT